MISPQMFVLVMLALYALNGVASILCGAFGIDRKSELREKYNAQDVIKGLLWMGIAFVLWVI